MMSSLNPWDLAAICCGYWHLGQTPSNHFKRVEINTNQIDANELFIAINGTNRDGHDFVKGLSAPAAAIVERPINVAQVPQLVVKSTKDALYRLATAFIEETNALKIAITGSVGKTGTKEMLATCLRQFGTTHANQGNYNNHLGVPLTILSMPPSISYLITEIGMNHKGEIAPLSCLVKPNIAIITKISESHIGQLRSLKEVANEKATICAGISVNGCIILPRDDEQYSILEKAAIEAKINNIISFGRNSESTIQLISSHVKETRGSTTKRIISFKILDKIYEISIGMRAEHWATNALSVIAACHFMGLDINTACDSLKTQTALAGRGAETKLVTKDFTTVIIDDAYNASPSSVIAALEDFATRPERNKIVILTDMLELCEFSNEMHLSIVPYIVSARPCSVILVGTEMSKIKKSLQPFTNVYAYSNVEEAKLALIPNIIDADLILIKGSHGSGAHLLVEHLKSLHNKEMQNVV